MIWAHFERELAEKFQLYKNVSANQMTTPYFNVQYEKWQRKKVNKDNLDIALIPAIVLTAIADFVSYINNPDILLGIIIVGSLGNFLIWYFVSLGVISKLRR